MVHVYVAAGALTLPTYVFFAAALPLLLLPCAWLLVAVACNGASVNLFAALGSRLGTDFRQRLFNHLLEQPLDRRWTPGDEQALLTQQIPTLENVVVVQLPLFIWTVAQILLGVLLLLQTDWRLALVAVVLTPLLLLSQVAFNPALARREQQRVSRAALLLAYAAERLRGREVVDLFGLKASTSEGFAAGNGALMRAARRVGMVSGVQSAALTASALLTLVSVFALGCWLMLAGQLSVGQLVASMGIATAMVSGMWQLGTSLLPLQAGSTALDLLQQQLQQASAQRAQAASVLPAPPPLSQGLVLDQVQFRYPDGGGLTDLCLTIPAGSSLALVGPSGGGKSTVLRLLLRQLQPQFGSLKVDGIDLNSTGREQWLHQVALVPQESDLFDLSIADNIRLGRLEASDAEVAAAAEAAELGSFVASLPEGLNTVVGPGGGRLSGGQRQRIAIARAILRNPRLLLLDEATSALDAQSEAAVQNALENLMKDRTSLVIAHRLATVVRADRILLMDRGRLQAVGTHESLIVDSALYRTLAELQFSAKNILS